MSVHSIPPFYVVRRDPDICQTARPRAATRECRFWLHLPECAPFSCEFDSGSWRSRLRIRPCQGQRQSSFVCSITCFNHQLLRQVSSTGVGRCDKTARWRLSRRDTSALGTLLINFFVLQSRRRATYLYAANKYRVIRIFRCQCQCAH
jgi:hypothetical protein